MFVHGLGGHYLETWTDADSGKTWISDPDFLSTLAGKVRVMTFGYNANVFKNVTTSHVADHANDLLEELVVRRRGCKVSVKECLRPSQGELPGLMGCDIYRVDHWYLSSIAWAGWLSKR